jgi:hypothetical protein
MKTPAGKATSVATTSAASEGVAAVERALSVVTAVKLQQVR